MRQRIPVAWLQLSKEKARLTIALAGVAFAVILVSMQLGFQSSMFVSAVRYHQAFQYDLVMLNPSTPFIGYPDSFSRRRLIQALAADGVEAVTPVYMRQAQWKNPWQHNSRGLLLIGFDPSHDVLAIDGVQENLDLLKLPDTTPIKLTFSNAIRDHTAAEPPSKRVGQKSRLQSMIKSAQEEAHDENDN